MIRRTLQSGLLAAVAVLAILPTAAGAAPAGGTTPYPTPAAGVRHTLPSQPARHRTARHHRSVIVRTASHRRGIPVVGHVVTHRLTLNVRSGPGTGYRVVGHRRHHRLVALTCKRYGTGAFGNHTWYRLSHHRGYVSARYVRVDAPLPWC
ncbi:SH3 domain-containing protein [Streptomyces capoamus]|uniref:SH3 domain-containing protein n=1 Tax=Streptomyces capoamus TaxID=68183 RepID=UPI0033977836